MSEFLSEAWFESIADAASSASAPADLAFTIEQVVEGEPTVRWQVQVLDERVAIDLHASAEPDVRITTDRHTATEIQAGRTSAQRAFLDGRLRIGGDIQALMANRQALADLAPALGLT
ncbi:MAG: SCP2 sterol-binding domain-containing protein [Actinomycetota bacterium]